MKELCDVYVVHTHFSNDVRNNSVLNSVEEVVSLIVSTIEHKTEESLDDGYIQDLRDRVQRLEDDDDMKVYLDDRLDSTVFHIQRVRVLIDVGGEYSTKVENVLRTIIKLEKQLRGSRILDNTLQDIDIDSTMCIEDVLHSLYHIIKQTGENN